jgi:legumain
MVDGKEVGSCLGDLFSIAWMEDSDLADFTKESLRTQFASVKKTTTMSEVMQWGDLTFNDEVIGHFLGRNIGSHDSFSFQNRLFDQESEVKRTYTAVDARDIKL